jgi:hypothetical protein
VVRPGPPPRPGPARPRHPARPASENRLARPARRAEPGAQLELALGPALRREAEARWDEAHGGVLATRRLRLGDLTLREAP